MHPEFPSDSSSAAVAPTAQWLEQFQSLRIAFYYLQWEAHRNNLLPELYSQDTATGPLDETVGSAATCVIANAVPKCGTYLLNQLIASLGKAGGRGGVGEGRGGNEGGWHNTKIHLSNAHYHHHVSDRLHHDRKMELISNLHRLKAGQVFPAHIGYDADLAKAFEEAHASMGLRHVFMYRDPRDALVSQMYFVAHSPRYRAWSQRTAAHQDFLQYCMENDAQRLAYVLADWGSMGFHVYHAWRNAPGCLSLSFEELYADTLELESGRFGSAMTRLIEYVGMTTGDVDPIALFKQAYGSGPTARQERDKIGQFRRLFQQDHWQLLDTPTFRELVAAYGYAW